VRHREAHGKEKQLTAPTTNGTLRPLSCAGKKRTEMLCLCRAPLEKTHDNLLPLLRAFGKNARQSFALAVRLWKKRTAIYCLCRAPLE
jgi:hypothetical protein